MNWKEVHANFSAKEHFTPKQLKNRWEVMTQTSNSTARARQCKESLYAGDPYLGRCLHLAGC